jgi:predicted RNA binding protein YcfA (HicA-like mRNA interferase family)
MQSREIIDSRTADGWRKVAQKGSHVQFKHLTKPGKVTVPHPKRDVPIGTLRSISNRSWPMPPIATVSSRSSRPRRWMGRASVST